MSKLSLYTPPTDLKKWNEHGKMLYKQHDNYKVLANLLEHPEFKWFFDEHFKTWDHVKNIVMFIKLYKEIEKSSTIDLNGYQKLSVIDNIMKDQDIRQQICHSFTEFVG